MYRVSSKVNELLQEGMRHGYPATNRSKTGCHWLKESASGPSQLHFLILFSDVFFFTGFFVTYRWYQLFQQKKHGFFKTRISFSLKTLQHSITYNQSLPSLLKMLFLGVSRSRIATSPKKESFTFRKCPHRNQNTFAVNVFQKCGV